MDCVDSGFVGKMLNLPCRLEKLRQYLRTKSAKADLVLKV